jgi:hypothetical protein
MARSVAPAQRQQQQQRQQQVARPMRSAPVAQSQDFVRDEPVRTKKGGGWKVVLQFVIGLAVIAGVAAAIVWLYIKYYQQ